MNGYQDFPASLTHLLQVVKILFSEKEAWRLKVHNSDPSTLSLLYIHCQKTTPCLPVLVCASPWTLTLVLLDLHHHSSLLNSASRVCFWEHTRPTKGRNLATGSMKPASEQKKNEFQDPHSFNQRLLRVSQHGSRWALAHCGKPWLSL